MKKNNNNENEKNNMMTSIKRSQSERMTFQDMIIFTIQRFPKYSMFITRLIAVTPQDHNDYESLQQAKEKLQIFLDKIGRPDQPSSIPCWQKQTPQRPITIQMKDLATLIDETQWICNQYPSDCLVYIFDNLLIKKQRKQQETDGALFVLSDSVLLAEKINRNKRRSFSHEYRLQQMIPIENLDLRCQCWQRNLNNNNNNNNAHQQQQQQQQQQQFIGPLYNCPGCIDTLHLDVQKIYELQSLSTEIETLPIRRTIERTFTNYLLLIVKQLAEMKESLFRCSKERTVDLLITTQLDRNYCSEFNMNVQKYHLNVLNQ
nr:uncharacterized protein LOC124499263 [Dermatophagoides farinae]